MTRLLSAGAWCIVRPTLQGKSGGCRVITFFTGPAFPVFPLNAFVKNETANLTKVECAALKKILSAITSTYKKRKESK